MTIPMHPYPLANHVSTLLFSFVHVPDFKTEIELARKICLYFVRIDIELCRYFTAAGRFVNGRMSPSNNRNMKEYGTVSFRHM